MSNRELIQALTEFPAGGPSAALLTPPPRTIMNGEKSRMAKVLSQLVRHVGLEKRIERQGHSHNQVSRFILDSGETPVVNEKCRPEGNRNCEGQQRASNERSENRWISDREKEELQRIIGVSTRHRQWEIQRQQVDPEPEPEAMLWLLHSSSQAKISVTTRDGSTPVRRCSSPWCM